MNTKSVVTTLAILLLTPCLSFAGNGPCSARSIAGDWGFTTTGLIILPTGPVPVAAVGKLTQEVDGNTKGSQVRSLGGAVATETFNGTILVNADCTAHYTLYVYDDKGNPARTSTLDAVFTDDSNHARVIIESSILPNGTSLPSVLTLEADKLSPK